MKSLPKKPNLEYLKNEAKALRALHRQGLASCCERIRQNDSAFKTKTDADILSVKFSINDAQRIVAREYGYSSWATLKKYIESLSMPLYHGVSDRQAYHETITNSYDKRSVNYDNSQWHRDVAINTVNYCPPEEGQKVLDVATGTGTIAFYTSELVGSSGHVIGIDISNGMLNKCNEKLASSNLNNLEFQFGDGENLDFPPNSFDRIYCSSAFFWMSHPLATLRHWYELLKPGGQIGFNTSPSKSFFWGDGARRALAKHGIQYICNIPAGDHDDARRLVELAGFTNFRFHQVENGCFLKTEETKKPLLTLQHYAPGQHPHPLENVSEDTLRLAQRDYEAEIDELATEQGVWHDMTQYYIFGQKALSGRS
ncbi:class I SAM-dependent methyltransferase [Kaarinaea lacus]